MSLNVKKIESTGGSTIEPMEAGAYPARIVIVADIGVQQQSFQGKEKEPRQEILITYEFLDEFMKDEDGNEDTGKPRWLSENFALHSLEVDRAKSTTRYNSLDPKGQFDGDFTQMIGLPCIVTVTESPDKKDPNKFWNNIGGVTSMREKEATKAPELVNTPVVFTFDDETADNYFALPEWIREKKIGKSLNFEGSTIAKMAEAGEPEDKPKKENSSKAAKRGKREGSKSSKTTLPPTMAPEDSSMSMEMEPTPAPSTAKSGKTSGAKASSLPSL